MTYLTMTHFLKSQLSGTGEILIMLHVISCLILVTQQQLIKRIAANGLYSLQNMTRISLLVYAINKVTFLLLYPLYA